jgi:carbamoyl-phosphate synthase small subunit
VAEIKKLLGKVPVFGIEFGNLLLGMAFGGETMKQRHGHRGGNQPVRCMLTKKVYISSQNHGYVLLPETLKEGTVSFVNVNDGTCEGVDYDAYKAFGVQFAPESCGVTGEENPVYAKFFTLMTKEKENA